MCNLTSTEVSVITSVRICYALKDNHFYKKQNEQNFKTVYWQCLTIDFKHCLLKLDFCGDQQHVFNAVEP